jgi:hypothetical protein
VDLALPFSGQLVDLALRFWVRLVDFALPFFSPSLWPKRRKLLNEQTFLPGVPATWGCAKDL